MIDKSIYPSLAKKVLDSVDVREGDAVFIEGGEHQREFIEEMGIQVIRRGGEAFIQCRSDEYRDRSFEASAVELLKTTPRIHKAIAESIDVNIRLEPYKDPGILLKHKDKMPAYREGFQPIWEVLLGKNGKRWVFMGWPTEEMARGYGIPIEELERLIIGGCDIDYGALRESCSRMIDTLKGARFVHVTDRYGTDFRLNIENMPFMPDNGSLTDEQRAIGDLGCNLPAGEVYCAPVSGDGALYCPVTEDAMTYSPIKGVMLRFKDGTLLPHECTAKEGQDCLREILRMFVDIDMKEYGEPNALKIAELGIGLNPVIDRPIGYVLTDEKIGGSVHVAFGGNDGFGGSTKSSMHCDFVTAPEVTMEAEYADGSKRSLIINGKML